MSVIYLLISISFFVAVCFLLAFVWALKTGQFKDRQTPAIRMLFEDDKKLTDKNQE